MKHLQILSNTYFKQKQNEKTRMKYFTISSISLLFIMISFNSGINIFFKNAKFYFLLKNYL